MMDLLLPPLLPLRGKLLLLLLLLMLVLMLLKLLLVPLPSAPPLGTVERRSEGRAAFGLARRHAAPPPDRMLAAASRLAMATRLSIISGAAYASPGQRKEHKGWRPHAHTRPHRHIGASRSSSINFCIAFAHVPPPVIMVPEPAPDAALPKWMQQLADEVAADEAKRKRDEESSRQNGSSDGIGGSGDQGIPTAFMALWGGLCALSLGAGATVGYRGFESTAAFEALDKMEKPTAASEAMASRYAVRAFGWGTALCFGTAAAAVAACRAMGIQTAADVGACSRTYLVPFDRWLRERGDWMVGLGQSCGRQLDGIFDGAARSWHTSWLAGAMRFRVERINEHHEKLETQREAQSNAAAATRIGPAAALDGGGGSSSSGQK